MKILKVLITMCLLFPLSIKAQSSSDSGVPSWANGYFKEAENSYIEVVSAEGYSIESARNKAAENVVVRRSYATGMQSKVSVKNGNIVVTGTDDLIVKSRVIDEYVERLPASGLYRVKLLVQTAKNPMYKLEKVDFTNRYKFSPRVFVPGMAQLHKGSTLKGYMFIGAEVLAIGGVVAFEGLRASYESKIDKTHNATARQNYINKASNMQNVRNGFIAGAVAIYVWNVIDGIVAKGKSHVEVGPAMVNVYPYATPESAGVGFCMNF